VSSLHQAGSESRPILRALAPINRTDVIENHRRYISHIEIWDQFSTVRWRWTPRLSSDEFRRKIAADRVTQWQIFDDSAVSSRTLAGGLSQGHHWTEGFSRVEPQLASLTFQSCTLITPEGYIEISDLCERFKIERDSDNSVEVSLVNRNFDIEYQPSIYVTVLESWADVSVLRWWSTQAHAPSWVIMDQDGARYRQNGWSGSSVGSVFEHCCIFVPRIPTDKTLSLFSASDPELRRIGVLFETS
jgi:hypothetical protein